jgi:chromosome segregation ATPase
MPDASDNTTIEEIERKLETIRDTAFNLDMLASRLPDSQAKLAEEISAKAMELRAQQFTLHRQKIKIELQSRDWKDLVARIDVVNAEIAKAIDDVKKVKEVLEAVAKAIEIAARIAAAVA